MAELDAESSWGSLHVYCSEPEAKQRVRSLVIEAYAAAGLKPVPWESPRDLGEVLDESFITDLNRNEQSGLGEDEVFVLQEYAPDWYAVLSHRWEWAPAGKHPLALELSKAHAVLSITCMADRYAEYTRYENGAAVQMTLVGPEPPAESPAGLPALDLDWFEDKGAACPSEGLRAALTAPERFAALAGPDWKGLRDSFEAAPLEDYAPEDFLVFRKR